MKIETRNLYLIPCDTEILASAIKGDKFLAKKICASIPENWTEFGVGALQYSLDKLAASDEEKNWWTYLPIHKQDNILIGIGGYQGKPTNNGTVEIGYEIALNYRNRGFATEFTNGLIDFALRDERVKSILAHTLGHINPSTRVLQKCGFEKIEEIEDPVDGLLWKWELKKDNNSKSQNH